MSATGTKMDLATVDGVVDVYVSYPDGPGPWPAIVLYMDALGPRPTMFAMADRLASFGYGVFVPNLFRRMGAFEPFDPKVALSGSGPEFERLKRTVAAVDEAGAMSDTRAILDHIEREPKTRGKKIGVTGYCMGGGMAVCAAVTFPDQVVAAASFHGGRFVTDPASPALLAKKARAAFYLGVAEIDRQHTPEVTRNLEAAFAGAGVPHTVELYAGAKHGFAVPDHPAHDAAAADRHWERTREFFARALR